MHPVTHAIADFENEDDAKAAGHTIPLTKKEARHLRQPQFSGKNRHERRAELSRMRGAQQRHARRG